MIQIIKYTISASIRNATTDDSEESVIDKLDKIQQDFKSDSNNKPSEQSNQQASPSNKTENNKEESSTTTNQSDSDSKDDKSNDGRRSTLERLASDTDQIRDSKINMSQMENKIYKQLHVHNKVVIRLKKHLLRYKLTINH